MLAVKHGRVAVILWAYFYLSVKGTRNCDMFYGIVTYWKYQDILNETRIIIPKKLVKKLSWEIKSSSFLSSLSLLPDMNYTENL